MAAARLFTMLQLLLPVLSLAILGADASAGGETLHAGGDISLGIDIVAAGKALSYSVIVDGAIWLQSGHGLERFCGKNGVSVGTSRASMILCIPHLVAHTPYNRVVLCV